MTLNNHDFWKGRKVLVTGANGLVGSWLVKELLGSGALVIALIKDHNPHSELERSGDIRKISIVNAGLEDFLGLERAVNEHEIDTVFHLGAQTIVGVARRFPLNTFEANVRGTYNLLEACRLHQDLVKCIVVASSDKAYGDQPRLPYTEQTPLQGQYPYDVSKSCMDLISQSYAKTYHLPIAIARCGNIYGGGDLNWSRIVPGTIRSFLDQQRPVIRSNGKYVRDYIYVKDVVKGYLHLGRNLVSKKLRGEAFNFSYETPLTVLDIVRSIAKAMACEKIKPKILDRAKAEILSQYLSSKKAKKVLGWLPEFGLEEGLAETIAWYRDFLKEGNS